MLSGLHAAGTHSVHVISAVPLDEPTRWALLSSSQMQKESSRTLPQGHPSAPHPSSFSPTVLPPVSGSWDQVALPGCPRRAGHTLGELTGHRQENKGS